MKTKVIAQAKIKTDKIDARVLAELARVGYLPEVWLPDEDTESLRQFISDRTSLVRRRTESKNTVHSILHRNLIHQTRTDLFGVGGRAWLESLIAGTSDIRIDELDRLRLGSVQSLQAGEVERIILTRPAVEAGERLGFLPGDLMAKVDPYLRPLYDALFDMTDPDGAQRLLDRGTVEVAPLAFMRGRTLNDSFIILDEAQNTTPEQMKMFLTRIGFGSKAVVTGDTTQVDVAGGRSGLSKLEPILAGIDGLTFVHLDRRDVVRHRIVQDIVDAYERVDASVVAPTDGPS
jgi:hypothetical protein